MKQIEIVEWIDSCQSHGWTDSEDGFISASSCFSVGFILHEDDKQIVISAHYSPKDNSFGSIESSCGQMAIPKCSIIERKVIGYDLKSFI